MSLVNDALKRATEAQKNLAPAPAAGLHLRPIEPVPQHKHGPGLVVPTTLLTIGAAAVLSLTLLHHKTDAPPAPAPAQISAVPNPAVAASITPVAPPGQTPVPATPVVEKKSAAAVVVPDPPAPVPQAPPPPAPLRLQAVFFNPSHPSAIISGKTVFVGDTIRELKVAAIGSASALLVNASQTNLLTLE